MDIVAVGGGGAGHSSPLVNGGCWAVVLFAVCRWGLWALVEGGRCAVVRGGERLSWWAFVVVRGLG